MPFWSGEKLSASEGVVDPFDPGQIDCNAYNLRMGNKYYRTSDHDSSSGGKKTELKQGEAFVIPPGQFAFLLTKEVVNIPHDSMAFISMRTAVKLQGLINVSGFHVDPGYKGNLVYGVYNASPSNIQICEGDNLFKIWFSSLDRESSGKHVFGKQGLVDITNEMMKGMDREIYSLQSLTEKMRSLEMAVDSKINETKAALEIKMEAQRPVIENLTFVWRSVVLGVLATVLVSILAVAWPHLLKWRDTIFERFYRVESSGDVSSPGPVDKTQVPSVPPAEEKTP